MSSEVPLHQLRHAFWALAGFPLVAPPLAKTQIVRDSSLQRANLSLEFRVGKHQLCKGDSVRPDVLCVGGIYIVRVHERLLPPAFTKRNHSSFARRLVTVRRRARYAAGGGRGGLRGPRRRSGGGGGGL